MQKKPKYSQVHLISNCILYSDYALLHEKGSKQKMLDSSYKRDKLTFSHCTTKTKAKRQIRLLRAIQNNPKFTRKKR